MSTFLRLLAILQMLTGLIVFIPMAWIDAWHHWLGIGHAPDDAVLRYVIRGGGYVQGVIGVLIWIIASDVVRYRPLVVAVGAIYLFSSPVLYLIDTLAGMPRFWCLLDACSTLTVGSIILALQRSTSAKTSQ